jgi:hypothetical protein
MSAPDASHLETPEAGPTAARVVINVAKVIAGLLVGAILGVVIASCAGWFRFEITC